MGTAFARIQPTERRSPLTPPSTLDLVPGALAGLALVTERRVRSVVVGVASGTASTARVVTRPVVVQRALRPLEDMLWNWNEVARREQARNRAEASAVLPMIVQQVTENVIAQLDLPRIVSQIPIEDIVEQVDIEAIVRRIDLAGVIRESTVELTDEAGRRAPRAGDDARHVRRRASSTGCCSASGRARSNFARRDDRAAPRARALQGMRAGFVSRWSPRSSTC